MTSLLAKFRPEWCRPKAIVGTILCASALFIAPVPHTDNPDAPGLTSFGRVFFTHFAANAYNSTDAFQPIADIKKRARFFDGPVVDQFKLGQIYSGEYKEPGETNYYRDYIHDDSKRNKIEAYFWYSLAAAQLDHESLLEDAKAADDSVDTNPLGPEERNTAKRAKDRMKTLRRGIWGGGVTGPSRWAAQKMFADIYREGGPAAHYVMGKYYKMHGGEFVEHSDFDAYAWMLAATMRNFPYSKVHATDYQGQIRFNQESLAEMTAQSIVAASQMFSGRPGNTSRSGSWGGSGSSGPGWGTDFQAHRQNRDAGNVRIELPDGVDSHHSSRSAYDMGNGYLAAGQIEEAKTMYEIAIAKEPYSDAAIAASRQLQALTLTCSMRDDRVARMSKPVNRDRVHDIPWDRIQLALKALGYYTAYVDGQPGLETRRAVRAFQREELRVDDTGYLTTDQRVELICSAAQNVRDADSQNMLGIMYANGIGLNCNTAAARAWFQKAADQGHPTGLYNLGLMYLEGFYDREGPGKVPYSDREQNIKPRRIVDPDIAKFYLKEAQEKGHPGAGKLLGRIGKISAKQAHKEFGVIGCIDYEVEVELVRIDHHIREMAEYAAEVEKSIENKGSESDPKPDSEQCKKLRDYKKDASSIRDSADGKEGIWNTTIVDYDKDMGQSIDGMVDRLPIKDVKKKLESTEGKIDKLLLECPSKS